jgi:uncharacterized protein (DUF488 family)
MLYTIGYQDLRGIGELVDILRTHGIEMLMDVRSRPAGQRSEFDQPNLAHAVAQAGIAYRWRGKDLGGFGKIRDEAVAELAAFQEGRKVCLFCMEADPDHCHRKLRIAARLEQGGITARHLVRDPETGRHRVRWSM